jgi:hypothetical protein
VCISVKVAQETGKFFCVELAPSFARNLVAEWNQRLEARWRRQVHRHGHYSVVTDSLVGKLFGKNNRGVLLEWTKITVDVSRIAIQRAHAVFGTASQPENNAEQLNAFINLGLESRRLWLSKTLSANKNDGNDQPTDAETRG